MDNQAILQALQQPQQQLQSPTGLGLYSGNPHVDMQGTTQPTPQAPPARMDPSNSVDQKINSLWGPQRDPMSGILQELIEANNMYEKNPNNQQIKQYRDMLYIQYKQMQQQMPIGSIK